MNYCSRCIIPDTRPNIRLDAQGVCNACREHELRSRIDWKSREDTLRGVAESAKQRSRGYDCIVPVSGGKDSTWQVVKCLELGLNVLAVTWKPPSRTPIGQANLENLIRLGVHHLDFQVNPMVEKRFLRAAYRKFGSTAIPMHMAMFNIPLKMAVVLGVPLVVWGENSAAEYGGTEQECRTYRMDRSWLTRFGVTHGTTARDWISGDLTEKDLAPYFGPTDEDIERSGVDALFLGYFMPWDPSESLRVAESHGFKRSPEGPKTGYYDYADIDDDFISVHHYLKWHKFGFTRSFDHLSLEIRNGRISRQKAIEILAERGEERPEEDIDRFCKFVGIRVAEFFETAERHRNPKIWERRNGEWRISDFLVPEWRWS